MAAALAQTQVSDLSSLHAHAGTGLRVPGEDEAEACGAPRPSLCAAFEPADAPAGCIDADDGITAGAQGESCSDPDGAHARSEPLVVGPDGQPYAGVLLDDILEYRSLRANMLAGNRIDGDAHVRYLELESRLRAQDDGPGTERGHIRAFHRFDVQLAAGVRFRIGRQRLLVAATIENISAGGVKLTMSESPPMGEAVWLQLRLPGGALAILPSRVIWARDNAIGLMFAGAPRWT
jgi:hypothetical protein